MLFLAFDLVCADKYVAFLRVGLCISWFAFGVILCILFCVLGCWVFCSSFMKGKINFHVVCHVEVGQFFCLNFCRTRLSEPTLHASLIVFYSNQLGSF